MIDVSKLNQNQKEAVLSDEPYLRVIAGAGSGKTRVLTMRIAHLIEDEDIPPYRILAITFTNKAANEMKERIRRMLDEDTGVPWISTIHSLCARILREDIKAIGWPQNFTIMDPDDQKVILKEAYKSMNIDQKSFPYGAMINYISNNKTAKISVEQAKAMAGSFSADKTKASVYEYYLRRQKELYALDFDDLIVQTVQLFQKHEDVLSKWEKRFHYILVDEFQDIDNTQYALIKMLAGKNNSLYVVGDPDQTIYTWRGADVDIIMNFEKDFKEAKTIVLNENYRSTSAILNGANSVIKNNKNRVDKELFTSRKSKSKIVHYSSSDDESEAAWIAAMIQKLHAKGKDYHDIAVLYRSNYLSRSLEKGLRNERIPYVIYGGLRFYERMEIKDAICYLRMVTSSDDLAFQRIINQPRRGIGNKTVETISTKARSEGISMYDVIRLYADDLFTGRSRNTLKSFVTMIENWKTAYEKGDLAPHELFERILNDSGYKAMLEADPENIDRIENLKELTDDIKEFFENEPDRSLDEYLQEVSLYTDRAETLETDYVQLMTVHAAKGLEFDTVFVADMNEGIFPSERSINESRRGIEEERRLAYVAFTRAKNHLYLTDAGGFSFVLDRMRTPSRFIEEIEPQYIENVGALYEEEKKKEQKRNQIVFDDSSSSLKDRLAVRRNVLKKGETVLHAKFGRGIVISCKNGLATIAFPYPYGVKTISAGHPSLQRVKADKGS